MRFLIVGTAFVAGIARAANHVVQVAPGNALQYNPSSLSAAQGDTVEFQFMANNHSVAQSSFSSPCQPLTGGIWSGFILTTGSGSGSGTTSTTTAPIAGYKRQASTPSFTIMVQDTNPAFFYCAQIGHCQRGMVFALNPNGTETLNAYKSAASGATTTIPTESPQGGTLSTGSAGSATNSPSPASKSAGAILSSNMWALLLAACASMVIFV